VIPDDLAQEQLAELTQEIKSFEERRNSLPVSAEKIEEVVSYGVGFLENLPDCWRQADHEN
jgi:hypothetical protein